MTPAAEIDLISPDLFVWHRYDAEVKADLFATGLLTLAGIFLVDPFDVDPASLARALRGGKVVGIIVSNANHVRLSARFAGEFSVPIYAHRETQAVLSLPAHTEVVDRTKLSDEVTVVSIDGAAPGEIALYSARESGTAILGDALINFGAYGFSFLPGKYCSNPKLMRKSLRKLLDFRFERMLFAHGAPILSHGRDRLEELLGPRA